MPLQFHSSRAIVHAGLYDQKQLAGLVAALDRVQAREKQNAVYLDIGTNIGAFALAIASIGYDVVAFEGMERNQQALYSSLCASPELLSRVTIFPYALGAQEQACTVLSDSTNQLDGHVTCSPAEKDKLTAAGYTVRSRTQVVTLHEYMAGAHIDVLKMDVEGFEPQVIAGAGAHIIRCYKNMLAFCAPIFAL